MTDKPEMVTIHFYDVNSDLIRERQVTRERFDELVDAGVIERKAGEIVGLKIWKGALAEAMKPVEAPTSSEAD